MNLNRTNIASNCQYCGILEVHLEQTAKLPELRNDYPLLPDKQLNPNAEFDTQKIIEAMILVVMPKSKVTLKLYKPVQVGMCIIDLSKVLMYEFHNDFIKTNIVATQDFHSLIMIV